MPATLQLRLTGGSVNSDPSASLGGVMSANQLSATPLNNLFDNVSPDEAAAGDTEYRMVDVYNSGDAPATSVEIYIDPQTSSTDTSLEMGEDGVNNPHTAAANLETLADEETAPASPVITFGEHGPAAKLALPDIPAGEACRIALKRIVGAAAVNTSSDQATLKVVFA
ncbi:MAG: hypothetical protein GXP56_10410 [Deltaproteobacteria bacterium]|nr:hypothetical protein [Deltaproteobacteria bacterium]